jgi:thioredoxin 1
MSLTTRIVEGERAERLLVLLHGIGSNEQDLPQLGPLIDPEGHFTILAPRGPYAYGPGYAWFKIDQPDLARPTVTSSLQAIDEVVDEALSSSGLRAEEMIVGGFSMGGAMSLIYAFRAAERPRPAGVLVMSGFLPPVADLDWSGELPPVLMQHGTQDPMVQIGRAREAAQELRSHDVPVTFRTYPMQHNVTPESARDAKDWLELVRRGERPSGLDVQVSGPPEEVDDGPVASVSSANFQAEVLASEVPVIVDFWAPWCQPCHQIAPIVQQIAEMRKGSYKVVKCNIDESPDIAQAFDIQSIPLVALFRGGRLERKSLGVKPRPQLEAELGMLVIP